MLNAPELLRLLSDAKVEFVVIGGMAMITHGSSHVTEDIDICYARNDRNLIALAAALSPIHPYLRGVPPGLPFRWDVQTLRAGMNFTLTTDLGAIDLLAEVTGLGGFDKVLAQSDPFTVFDMQIRVLSLAGLIVA